LEAVEILLEGNTKMQSAKIRILIVDDDIQILEIITEMLESEDYDLITAIDGKSALQLFNESRPNLVLLDIKLPDIDGYTICRYIKKVSNIPVIMVTGKIEAVEEVEGLYVGADDYITKPFRESVLIARIKAMLRRNPGSIVTRIFKSGNMEMDFVKQTVKVDSNEVELTSTEFKIFAFLTLHRGKIVTNSEMLKEIWGEDNNEANHVLQVNISRLRKKLNDNIRKFNYIETIPDVGYRLHGID
jgi:DNA-binding response OmpR family regulator